MSLRGDLFTHRGASWPSQRDRAKIVARSLPKEALSSYVPPSSELWGILDANGGQKGATTQNIRR